MHIDITPRALPAGVTIRATPEGATLSVWAGNREMIAHLAPPIVAEAAAILTARHGHMQCNGAIREFTAPNL